MLIILKPVQSFSKKHKMRKCLDIEFIEDYPHVNVGLVCFMAGDRTGGNAAFQSAVLVIWP